MNEELKHTCDECQKPCKEKFRKLVVQENGIAKEKWVCKDCFYKRGRQVI